MPETVLVALPTATDLLGYLGWAETTRARAQATAHLTSVTAVAKAYTRGKGFDASGAFCADDIARVIISAAARSLPNPGQFYRIEAGSMNATPNRLEGFTLAEQAVLNNYRVRIH